MVIVVLGAWGALCTKSHLLTLELLGLEKTFRIVKSDYKQNKANLMFQHEFSITGFQEFPTC